MFPVLTTVIDPFLQSLVALTAILIVLKVCRFYVCRKDFFPPGKPLDLAYLEASSWLGLLATIASTAPFIGLAGTVLHIMEALGKLSSSAGDVAVISGPIAASLKSTLWGLLAAIPASAAHNLLIRKLNAAYSLAKLEGRE